jgi:hypothetical protein
MDWLRPSSGAEPCHHTTSHHTTSGSVGVLGMKVGAGIMAEEISLEQQVENNFLFRKDSTG